MTEAINPVATPEVKKQTRAEKLQARAAVLVARITADTEAYNSIKAELEGAEALASVAVGSVVQIKLGRKFADKDTTRIVAATVVGIREDEDGGKQYKVAHGAGFDADIAVVQASQIVGVGAAAPATDFVTGEVIA